MQKTYILIFLLLSIPIPSLCDEINDWLFYDVKTQTTTEITLPEDVTTNPISAPNNLIEITGTANKYQKPAVTLMFSQSEKETPGIRKDYLCSGALVGQNIVLTAAHCTMDKKKMFVDNIEIFAPGVTDLPHAQSTKIIIPKQYETGIIVDSKEYKEYDYAFILLDTPLGERLGYFGTKRYFIPRLLHKKIQILGRGKGTPIGTLWLSEGYIGTINLKFIGHNARATHGYSGSPIILADDPGNIIAINIWKLREKTKYPNGGLLITSTMEKMILQLRTHYKVYKEIENRLKQLDKKITDKISVDTFVNGMNNKSYKLYHKPRS